MKHLAVRCGVALVSLLAAADAEANDETPFAMSSEAAISGGAVMAAAKDVGSTWYNPAAIAGVKRAETEVNGEAFGARITRAPGGGAFAAGSDVATPAANSTEVLVVPTTIGQAFAVNERWALGFGIFAPVFADAESAADEDGTYVRSRRSVTRYHLGLLAGWQAHPDVRVGLRAMMVYDELRVQHRTFADPAAGVTTFDGNASVTTFGADAALGVAARVHRMVQVGASLETATFVLDQSAEGTTQTTETNAMGTTVSFDRTPLPEATGGHLGGWRGAAGVQVGQGIWSVASDAYVASKPSERVDGPGWGLRLGAKVMVGKLMAVGGGAWLDRNIEADAGWGSFRGQRYGGSLGVDIVKPVRLAKGESAATLEFRTTVAARYAFETGTIGGRTQLERLLDDPESTRGDATRHIVLLHVGTGLAF
ncbi:MAG: outer membrane protein transport protein [Myxococcota bacterium]